MNLDFHYYGTYCAALEAGYAKEEAKKIAYYAQFVDECTTSLLKANGINEENALFVPTVQSTKEMVAMMLKPVAFGKEEISKISKIWAPFHFLPGNTNGETAVYEGPTSDTASFVSWKYDESERKKFQLLCLPNSDLLVNMIDGIIEDVKAMGLSNKLEHIGMAMHVLADTWAHYWFAGIPAWFINEVPGTVNEILEDGSKRALVYTYDLLDDNIPKGHYSCVPIGAGYNAMVYLGHGRIGHLPDYSFMVYDYSPMWKAGDDPSKIQGVVTRSNPNVFMSAYTQMVYALKCIRAKTNFDVDTYHSLVGDDRNEVMKIFKTRKLDTSTEWKEYIKNKYSDELPVFEAQAAFKAYRETSDKTNTDLVRFLDAAAEHVALVSENVLNECLG